MLNKGVFVEKKTIRSEFLGGYYDRFKYGFKSCCLCWTSMGLFLWIAIWALKARKAVTNEI